MSYILGISLGFYSRKQIGIRIELRIPTDITHIKLFDHVQGGLIKQVSRRLGWCCFLLLDRT